MTNLTLTIDEETLRRARLRAVERGTSVNAVVRRFLGDYADGSVAQLDARKRLVEMAQASESSSEGQSWGRDELYD